MSLLIRINLVFGGVFVLAAAAAGYACWGILEGNARREALAEAGLMLDSALATRDYTASEILPLLGTGMAETFPPQSVPFYAATQNFLQLQKRHPDYSYKEATLNPMNPRDRAADWEADIVQKFRNDPHAQEVIGERATPDGCGLVSGATHSYRGGLLGLPQHALIGAEGIGRPLRQRQWLRLAE
jgi:hypothetical protein